jgi:RecG-like helicase
MNTAAAPRRMPLLTLATEVRMIKGVGPQRAELLAKRGLHTLGDLLTYLPFRYEDRIHFSNIKDIQPNGIYTIRAKVMSGQAIRGMRGRDAIYHLLVQDAAGGLLPCKFFHGGYLEGRLQPGQSLVLHGKAEIDRLRPARLEMVNPQMEMLGEGEADSTEVGRIVPARSGARFTRHCSCSIRACRKFCRNNCVCGWDFLCVAKPSRSRISRRRASRLKRSTRTALRRSSG